jgi:hypothetical protein
VVQAGADWWVLVEASLRYACSPANRKSPFKGVLHHHAPRPHPRLVPYGGAWGIIKFGTPKKAGKERGKRGREDVKKEETN